eukprot:scaffold49483_cov24-Prasinocladus_malaysianus.AAC.1
MSPVEIPSRPVALTSIDMQSTRVSVAMIQRLVFLLLIKLHLCRAEAVEQLRSFEVAMFGSASVGPDGQAITSTSGPSGKEAT